MILRLGLDPRFALSVCVFFFFLRPAPGALFIKAYEQKKKEWTVTFHTFKNYFAIVFSVFSKISCIQTDPKSPFEICLFCWNWKLFAKSTIDKGKN